MAFTREQILAADGLKTAPIDIPEWGGAFTVREFSAHDRDEIDNKFVNDPVGVRALIAVKSLCYADGGDRVFMDTDVIALDGKSSLVLDRIFDVARELNGISKKAAQEKEKNLESAPSESSAST